MSPIIAVSDATQIGPTQLISLTKATDKLGRLGGQSKQVEVLQRSHHVHEWPVLLLKPVQHFGKICLVAADFPGMATEGHALTPKQMFSITLVLDEQHTHLRVPLQVAGMRRQFADVDIKTSIRIRNIGCIACNRMTFRRYRGHQQRIKRLMEAARLQPNIVQIRWFSDFWHDSTLF